MWATEQSWAVLAGLRFMLAFFVLCGHTFRIVHLDDTNPLLHIGGTSAVLGFLVISGISIAHSIHTRPEGFARRRILRIVPLYYASILFALVPVGLYGSSYFLSGGDIVILPSVKTIVGLFLFLQGLCISCPWLMQPLWSMSGEIFYYCFTPWLRNRDTQTIRVLIIGSLFLYALCLCLGHTSFSSDVSLVAAIALGWAWLAGFLLFREPHSAFAPLLLAAGTFTVPYPAFAGTVIVIMLAKHVRLSARAQEVCIYLGKLSYPLYLTHWTVLNIIGGSPAAHAHPWYLVPVAWLSAFAVAALFYHFFDVPFRQFATLQGGPITLKATYRMVKIPTFYFILSLVAISLWQVPMRMRILPLGDSITYGTTANREFYSGYRGLLEAKLEKAGLPVIFVGTQTDSLDNHHEGHPGWRIDEITRILPEVLKESRSDFILVQLGTNDLRDMATPSEIDGRLTSLLDGLQKDSQHPYILVASITPICSGSSKLSVTSRRVEDLNNRIHNAVQERVKSNKRIKFVDMYHESQITCSDIGDDGVHPNATGYTKIADTWFNALAPLIK